MTQEKPKPLARELQLARALLRRQAAQRNILCFALAALLLALPFAYTLTAPAQKRTQTQPQAQLAKAPDFTATDVITGEQLSLRGFAGTPVLLNFVNYGCDPNVNRVVSAQLLVIKNLTKERDDFIPLSVFCGCCPADTLREFALQNNLTWHWALDADYSIIKLYIEQVKRFGYPTLIFIDNQQYIRDYTGYLGKDTLSAKIDWLVGVQ
jgi:hypothetical protein